MANTQFLRVRIPPEKKLRIQAIASAHQINESIWVRQVVDRALAQDSSVEPSSESTRPTGRRSKRLYVRLDRNDQILLVERAAARAMQPATYVAVLLRAHLRKLSPLPVAELVALKRAVAELTAIGRNLNQIAAAINRTQKTNLPGRSEVLAMLKICEALRDHMRGIIKTNIQSWAIGYAKDSA